MDNNSQKETVREDINAQKSSLKGMAGLFETLLRRFRIIVSASLILGMYLVCVLLMGISIIPSVYLFQWIFENTQSWPQHFHYAALGTAIVLGYFAYGFTLMFVVPFANFVFRTRLKPWRGIYYSMKTVPWYIHNMFTYIMRYTFLQIITPSPFNIVFYRLMGMKIGKNVQINTTNISDPSLLEIGDSASIGGSATIICHYGVGGFLIIAPVRIGKKATVGLRAIVMGDVEIGDNAKILPNSVVMPKTKIPAGEIWGGVPAQFIRKGKGSEE